MKLTRPVEKEKAEILKLLREQEGNVTVEWIQKQLRLVGLAINRRTFRLIMEEMLMVDKQLISRSNQGIKLVRNEIDFSELIHGYKAQARTLERHANTAIQIWNDKESGTEPQLKIQF